MKKTILKMFAIASIVALTSSNGNAQNQNNLGAECGCPPVNLRPTIDLSTLTDGSGNLTAVNTVLTCNNNYLLKEKIYVADTKTITINPGTVILGRDLNLGGGNSSCLVISRGGKIIAAGTSTCGIVFTAENDLTGGTGTGANDNILGNYPVVNRGKWGGVAICGKATNNLVSTQGGIAVSGQPNGTGALEGFATGNADSRVWHGGTDDADNSGIMRYVSIRHAGDIILAGNELNALTLGSVGNGTTLDHIEIVSSDDDAIEFFGGTVNVKYAALLFGADDGLDYDINWRGNAQFVLCVAADSVTAPSNDNGIEADADDNNTNATPRSHPKIYNCTFIGNKKKLLAADNTGHAGFMLKERTEGEIFNSIVANYYVGCVIDKIKSSRPVANTTDGSNEAYGNWQVGFSTSGTLLVGCNAFVGCTNPLLIQDNAAFTYVANTAADNSKFAADGNTSAASLPGFDFTYVMNTADNSVTDKYDAVPEPVITTNCSAPNNGFFTPAAYRGAFEAGKKSWLSDWAILNVINATQGIVPCPTDINLDGTTNNADFLILLGEFGQSCD